MAKNWTSDTTVCCVNWCPIWHSAISEKKSNCSQTRENTKTERDKPLVNSFNSNKALQTIDQKICTS